jgi:hypothetical protein
MMLNGSRVLQFLGLLSVAKSESFAYFHQQGKCGVRYLRAGPRPELIKSTRPMVSGCEAAAKTKLSRWRGQRAAQQCRPSKVLRHWP